MSNINVTMTEQRTRTQTRQGRFAGFFPLIPNGTGSRIRQAKEFQLRARGVESRMVYTRARIRSEGKEAEIDEVERTRPDPQKIEREANKRRRLQNPLAAGSAPPALRRKLTAFQKVLSTRQKQKTRATAEEDTDAASACGLPEAVDEPLRTFRKQKAYQSLLHDKLQQLVSKADQIQALLTDSGFHQTDHLVDSEGGMEGFIPQNGEEKRLHRRYLRMREMIRDVRRRLDDVDAALRVCSERLVELLTERYGHNMSSVGHSNDQLPALEHYDVMSSEGGISRGESGSLPEDFERSAVERPEQSDQHTLEGANVWTPEDHSQQSTGRPARPEGEDKAQRRKEQQKLPFVDQVDHQNSGPELGPLLDRQAAPSTEIGDDQAGTAAESFESSEQFQKSQLSAERARRIARERLQSERNMFDRFWPTYKDYKCEWERQRDAGETEDSQSVLDRAFLEEGRYRTQLLMNAERDYRKAAWDAKDLEVNIISPNQTSVFPSDDSVDQDELDREEEDIESTLDRTKIQEWIQQEWQYGHPSIFDSPDVEPVRKPDPGPAQNPGEGFSALPEVPYGFCEEALALHRRRVHIDLWRKWAHADWQAMLQEGAAMTSTHEGTSISPPQGSPKPDPIRLRTHGEGNSDGDI